MNTATVEISPKTQLNLRQKHDKLLQNNKKTKKKKKQVCYTLYIVLLYYSSVSLHDKHIG